MGEFKSVFDEIMEKKYNKNENELAGGYATASPRYEPYHQVPIPTFEYEQKWAGSNDWNPRGGVLPPESVQQMTEMLAIVFNISLGPGVQFSEVVKYIKKEMDDRDKLIATLSKTLGEETKSLASAAESSASNHDGCLPEESQSKTINGESHDAEQA